MLGFLDYPDYIQKYPGKTFDDWKKYEKNYFYPMLLESFEEEKDTLTPEELKEAEKILAEMKSKL